MSPGSEHASPGALRLLAAGHASADMCQGAVPAMIPFLISQRGLSFTASTTLLIAMTTASSVVQPLFGLLADRRPSRWLIPAALVCAGLGITVAGVVDGLVPMVLGVTLSGLGIAAFHPEAAHRMRAVPDDRRATAMSHFALGGNVGFALAPAVLTPAVLLVGLPGAAVVLVPTLACGAALLLAPGTAASHGSPAAGGCGAGRSLGPFAGVVAIAALRSGVYFGLMAFLASYFVQELATSEAAGNAALTVMLVAGAAGTLVGGRLADRFDRRVVLGGYMVAVSPLLALLLVLDDPVAATAVVALVGFATVGNFSLTVVMGQEYMPRRPALASGITLGLAIGVGGLFAAGLGPLADRVGIEAVLWILVALPLLAAAVAAGLPQPASQRRSSSPCSSSAGGGRRIGGRSPSRRSGGVGSG